MSVSPPHDLHVLLRRQHAVISWRQARRHLTEKAIRHRVASGRWRRIHRGVYLTHTGPLLERQRWWAASLAVGNGRPALLAGPTALRVLGFRDRVPATLHVLRPAGKADTDPPDGVVVHRTRKLTDHDVHLTARPPCTRAARSLIDAARWAATDGQATTLIAAAFQQRLTVVDDVTLVLDRIGRIPRRSVIEAAVADAAGGAESANEIAFLRLCRRAGLPEPSRQAVRTDRHGRRRYRDVFFDRWRVQVEIDGGQHMEVKGWYADMRSGNEVAISGVRLLRFPGWAVRHRADEVIADVRAALEAAGWQGR